MSLPLPTPTPLRPAARFWPSLSYQRTRYLLTRVMNDRAPRVAMPGDPDPDWWCSTYGWPVSSDPPIAEVLRAAIPIEYVASKLTLLWPRPLELHEGIGQSKLEGFCRRCHPEQPPRTPWDGVDDPDTPGYVLVRLWKAEKAKRLRTPFVLWPTYARWMCEHCAAGGDVVDLIAIAGRLGLGGPAEWLN